MTNIDRTGIAPQIRFELDAFKAATVSAISLADATDLATTTALANANKAAINKIIAAFQAVDLMA